MSESLDKVRGIRELPLFPLPVVLYPGAPLPLHIFEPRYRQLLSDVQATNNLFGLSYFDASDGESTRPAIGSLGCIAEIREAQTLSDGRSNVMTVGVVRYRLDDYVDTDEPYLIGEVSYFEDDEEDAELLEPRARAVRDLFMRVARAARQMSNDRDDLPELPETSPQQLSFFIAAAVDFDVAVKLEMLEMRSTAERLKRLHSLLGRAVKSVEDRAQTQKIAGTNGHSKKKIDLP